MRTKPEAPRNLLDEGLALKRRATDKVPQIPRGKTWITVLFTMILCLHQDHDDQKGGSCRRSTRITVVWAYHAITKARLSTTVDKRSCIAAMNHSMTSLVLDFTTPYKSSRPCPHQSWPWSQSAPHHSPWPTSSVIKRSTNVTCLKSCVLAF